MGAPPAGFPVAGTQDADEFVLLTQCPFTFACHAKQATLCSSLRIFNTCRRSYRKPMAQAVAQN